MATVESKLALEKLEEGDLCEFLYCQQSGNMRWYRWTCTAVYLGRKAHPEDEIDISFRPQAGTSSMRISNIIQIDRIHRRDSRLARRPLPTIRGDDRVVLPKRMPGGAMEAPHEEGPSWVGDMGALMQREMDQALAAADELVARVPPKHRRHAEKIRQSMLDLQRAVKEEN